MMRKFAYIFALTLFMAGNSFAANPTTQDVINRWYKLTLELIRHTPTYTPPVASRSLAYIGVTGFEVVASGSKLIRSLSGQLNDLSPLPQRKASVAYDDAIVMQAALGTVVQNLFSNTGPTGQHVMAALDKKLSAEVSQDIAVARVTNSQAYGQAIAKHILAWSQNDGGAVVENLGFPMTYDLNKANGHWAPTNAVRLQQNPLLPNWGKNRPFAMTTGTICDIPAPTEYSEDINSELYRQATEVVETKKNLTPEQKAIAMFWADDAMLTVTPPGHWIAIALQILENENAPPEKFTEVLARLGIAQADAFIGCWNAKYKYNYLRPLTYIKKLIDPNWETFINTPPFPEYPSGHSTLSGAAATVLTQIYGDNFAFTDETGLKDGNKPRSFTSFWAAAEEAGISRLYGGIHFRPAIKNGLQQGRCIGAFATALKTRK